LEALFVEILNIKNELLVLHTAKNEYNHLNEKLTEMDD
jgi:hypothetical protein